MFTLNGGAVSWCSSKQSVVAGSTCEAEYIAASEAANEGVWMKEFISDLGTKVIQEWITVQRSRTS